MDGDEVGTGPGPGGGCRTGDEGADGEVVSAVVAEDDRRPLAHPDDDVQVTLHLEVRRPDPEGRLAEQGGTAFAGSPADFGRLIADDTQKWAKVVKFSGMKPD